MNDLAVFGVYIAERRAQRGGTGRRDSEAPTVPATALRPDVGVSGGARAAPRRGRGNFFLRLDVLFGITPDGPRTAVARTRRNLAAPLTSDAHPA